MGISGVFFGEMFYLCFTSVFYLMGGKTRIGGYDAGRIMTGNPTKEKEDVTKKEGL